MGKSGINLQFVDVKANNLGTGEGTYSCAAPFNTLNFKSLVGCGNVSLITGTSEIIISGASAGSIGGSNTQIQFNDNGTFGANDKFTYSASTCSVTLGTRAGASGNNSFTQGATLIASGNYSHAQGLNSQATGFISHAEGFNSYAIGDCSHAEGRFARSCGAASHAEGVSTHSCGYASHVEGELSCAIADSSHAEGQNTIALGYASHAEGLYSCAIGIHSHAEGQDTCAYGTDSHAEGRLTFACGLRSHAEGLNTIAFGSQSHAQGSYTQAIGNCSHSSGRGLSGCEIFASGLTSFIHSYNTGSQTTGHGALAPQSAILGGINHNIEVGNINAAIIGGNTIKLTGTSYIDTTTVSKFAIIDAPSNNVTTDQVLVRNTSTGLVDFVSKASLGGGTGVTTANNGLTKIGDNIVLGGTLTGDTTIALGSNGLAIGTGAVSTGTSSIALGDNSYSNGSNSFAIGSDSCATGDYAFAFGANAKATGNYAMALGCYNRATGINSIAMNSGYAYGNCSVAMNRANTEADACSALAINLGTAIGKCSFAGGSHGDAVGNLSIAFGGANGIGGKKICAIANCSINISFGDASQTAGDGTRAEGSVMLGGLNNNIESGNTKAVIIGGNAIDLTGTTYIDHTAVANLAIMTSPSAGGSDDVLTYDSLGRVTKVTQASIASQAVAVTVNNGLTRIGDNIVLGGALTGSTSVIGSGSENLSFGVATTDLNEFSVFAQAGCVAYAGKINLCSGYGSYFKNTCLTDNSLYGAGCHAIQGFGGQMGITAKSTWTGGTYGGSNGIRMRMAVYRGGIDACWRDFDNVAKNTGRMVAGPIADNGAGTCYSGVFLQDVVTIQGASGSNDFNANGGYAGNTTLASLAIGSDNCVDRGLASGLTMGHIVAGCGNVVSGSSINNMLGNVAIGLFNSSIGSSSFAIGRGTRSSGYASFAGGLWSEGAAQTDKAPQANANGSFGFFSTNTGQTDNHGANAVASAILGGINHNIESGNTRAAIIGGNSIKLTGSTYIDTTAVDNFAVMSAPSAGVTGDTVLVRNSSTGIIKGVSQASLGGGGAVVTANNGLTKIGDNIVLGGTLTGGTTINTATFGVAIGNGAIATGLDSFAIGNGTCAAGDYSHAEGYGTFATGGYGSHAEGGGTCATGRSSHAEGYNSKACGDYSHAQGKGTQAQGNYSHAEGAYTCAIGGCSHAEGQSTRAIGIESHAEGNNTYACGLRSHAEGTNTHAIGTSSHAQGQNARSIGESSHASGCGATGYGIYACGNRSFNHSANDASQIAGHGALALESTILGGCNHNIESGNTRAAIIGGNSIKLTGTTYIDHTAVANLAIMSAPSAGVTGDTVLVRNSSTGIIKEVTQASLGGGGGGTPAGSNTEIQFNNAGSFGAGSGFTFSASTNSLTLGGVRIGASGVQSFAIGNLLEASGLQSFAQGQESYATGDQSAAINHSRATGQYATGFGDSTNASGTSSIAMGNTSIAYGVNSFAGGDGTRSIGYESFAFGRSVKSIGHYSHAGGTLSCAFGESSFAFGCGALACGGVSFAQGEKTFAIGDYSFAQNNETCAVGFGSHAGGNGMTGCQVLASGYGSFNHSTNNVSQVAGHGALADQSAILGGQNNNIESGNTGATIIGGSTIKLTGTTYVDTTAVDNLAIITAPSAGGANDLLTWESGGTGAGIVRKVTQASVSDGRLKTSLKPIENSLEGVISLNGYEYEFNALMQPESMIGKKKYGLIAQEVEAKFPLVVNNNLKFGDETYKTVEYRELVPILVEAIKELNNKNTLLEERVRILEEL